VRTKGLRLWVVYCCLHGFVGVGSSRLSDERDKNISALCSAERLHKNKRGGRIVGLRLWVVYCCLHGCMGVGSSRLSDERDKNISAQRFFNLATNRDKK